MDGIQIQHKRKIGPAEAMSMNRHQRRRLGKENGVRIPGIQKPWKGYQNKKKK